MRKLRVIPLLLLHEEGFYKTINYSNPRYIGDPINTIRLFNDLEADEIVIIDIDATKKCDKINNDFIQSIVSEAFMPVTYGGGIKTLQNAKDILSCGVEKILVNNIFLNNPKIIFQMSNELGRQSIVISLDVIYNQNNQLCLYDYLNKKITTKTISSSILDAMFYGAGEILISSVNKEGTLTGLDLNIFDQIDCEVKVPLIISGGANSNNDFKAAKNAGASGVAAGSMFVYHGGQNSILINYPSQIELNEMF